MAPAIGQHTREILAECGLDEAAIEALAEGVMRNDLVLAEIDGPIARLTLNDPARANVLSAAMMTALRDGAGRGGRRSERCG